MISSSNYQNRVRIREFFQKLIDLPNYIEIVGAGNNYGADLYIKELALELELGYKEYNPFHTAHNVYSAYPKYRYGKKFNTANLAIRYADLIKDCDKLVVFQDKNASDTFIDSIVKKVEKNKITCPSVILYE